MTCRNSAALVGAHHQRRAHPDFLDRLHAGPGVEDHRKRRDEADDQDRGEIAEPEPQHDQRRIGDAGDRRADRHQRQEIILGALRAAHGDADGDADHAGEREAREQPQQRFGDVMRQNAGDGETPERRGDLLQRRKQPRREHAGMRGDLPHRADHQERKRQVRGRAQTALAARRRGAGNVSGGNGVGHGEPGRALALSGTARVGGLSRGGKRGWMRHLR